MTDLLVPLVFNGIVLGTVLALVALGFSFGFAVREHFHLAHLSLWLIAGYILFLVVTWLPSVLGLVTGLLLAALVVALLAVGCVNRVYAPLQRRGAGDIFIASLALLTIAQSMLAILFGTKPRYFDIGTIFGGGIVWQWQAVYVEWFQAVFLALALPMLAGISIWLRLSRQGRLLGALVQNRELATIVGIDVPRIITVVYAIGAVPLALAAIVLVSQSGIAPYAGLQEFLLAIAAALAVRTGRFQAVIGAAYLLALIREISLIWIPGHWQTTVAVAAFVVLITVFRRAPAAKNA